MADAIAGSGRNAARVRNRAGDRSRNRTILTETLSIAEKPRILKGL
jgi:hypothetical protein